MKEAITFFKDLEFIKYEDSKFKLWEKHGNSFISTVNTEFNAVSRILSFAPKTNYIEFLNIKKGKCLLEENLLYFNHGDYDFIIIPDTHTEFIKTRFNEIHNNDLIWKISPSEFEFQWEQICNKLSIKMHVNNLQRFANWNLLSEGVPISSINSSDQKYNFFGKLNCSELHRYSTLEKSLSDEFWRITLDYLRFRFNGRQPWLDPAQIKMDLFGRISSSLDRVKSYENAVLIAALLVLSKCPSFSTLRNTNFLLNGERKSLSEFHKTDFCVDKEKAKKFLSVQKIINKKIRASSTLILSD